MRELNRCDSHALKCVASNSTRTRWATLGGLQSGSVEERTSTAPDGSYRSGEKVRMTAAKDVFIIILRRN